MRFKLAAEPFVCMCVRVWISVGEGGGWERVKPLALNIKRRKKLFPFNTLEKSRMKIFHFDNLSTLLRDPLWRLNILN